jgi:DNA-binding PadR family transcriptional regulator
MGLGKNEIDLVILGLLMGAPLHGYMIKQAIEGNYGDRYFKVSNSALYPALARLEKEGYIEGKRELQEAVPDKKVYHITEAGKKKIVDLVATPIEPSSTPGATDFNFKVHAVHFGFITKEQRRAVIQPFYENSKVELQEALDKRVKLHQDLDKYMDMLDKDKDFKEKFGNYLIGMTRIPMLVLDQGIEELESKMHFYEKLMEMD